MSDFPKMEYLPQRLDEQPELPDGVGAHQLLQMVYRGEVKVSPQQMRAAIECLQFETPKLQSVGVGFIDGTAFADRLERALRRSEGARLINGSCETVEDEGR
jgi:hypothetical protein